MRRILRAFHAAPRPADRLLTLLLILAAAAFFAAVQWMQQAGSPLASRLLGLLSIVPMIAAGGAMLACVAALPWATFRPGGRRALLIALVALVVVGPLGHDLARRLQTTREAIADQREANQSGSFMRIFLFSRSSLRMPRSNSDLRR